MSQNPIIVTKHLSHTYVSGQVEKKALDDITLEIAQGSCVAIVGVNGSGKTTLVQHFNGLLRPTAGIVLVDGIDVSAKGVDLRALRQRVGLLFQLPETQLFGRTVYEDVAFGPRRMRLSRREVRARVLDALETVGLPSREYARRAPFELSGGQRRRVALAGVLAMVPEVLVLDEVSIGLDGEGRAEFYSYLRRIREERGVTIVLVSHDMAEVASLAEWLFVLHEGHLVMQGSPRSVFSQGDALREWGLVVPPLSELLMLLRKQGIALPEGTLTVDEAFAALAGKVNRMDNVGSHPGNHSF
jgi:energy-coupling factor transport system ATP-binding protein